VACDARRKTIKKTPGKQGVDQVNGQLAHQRFLSGRQLGTVIAARCPKNMFYNRPGRCRAGFLGFALENACAWRGERNRQKAQLF
jgi:hypothetical protein